MGLVLASSAVLQGSKELADTDFEDELNFEEEYDTQELRQELGKIQTAKKVCLIKNGINRDSFKMCMGPNFKQIDQSFLNYYKKRELIVLDSFENSIEKACEVDINPCSNLKQVVAMAMRNRVDPVDALEASVKPALEGEGVNRAVLKFEIQKFANQYNELDHSKTTIVEFVRETVDLIKKHILETKILLDQDLIAYQPNKLLVGLGLMISPKIKTSSGKRTINWGEDELADESNSEEDYPEGESDSDSHKDFKGETDLFNYPLLDETASKRMVSFYLSNPKINLERIDFTKMPSEILEDINELLKNKKIL